MPWAKTMVCNPGRFLLFQGPLLQGFRRASSSTALDASNSAVFCVCSVFFLFNDLVWIIKVSEEYLQLSRAIYRFQIFKILNAFSSNSALQLLAGSAILFQYQPVFLLYFQNNSFTVLNIQGYLQFSKTGICFAEYNFLYFANSF